MMKKKLAALLRTWADRLDPPIVACEPVYDAIDFVGEAFPVLPPVPPVDVPLTQFRVVRAEEVIYEGDSGKLAAQHFLAAKLLGDAQLCMNDAGKWVIRDWWPR